jgi:ABC-type Fe3+-hydroxamate transport system substrate-binding protein
MRGAAPPAADRACDAVAENVDWSGVAHARAAAPRIASLVPSLTELLFALGLGERVVARTGFCVHPRPAITGVPKIGGTKDPDLRKLRALAPTHLIVNVDENRRDVVDAAREFVPSVIVTHPAGPVDNVRLYRLFGAIFAREARAAELARNFADALATLDAAAAGLRRESVVYVVWRNPWMCVTRDTYVGATLARAGLDVLPAHAERRYPDLADDDAAWRAADRILLATEPYAFRPRDATRVANWLDKPVHLIDGEWTSWYGVRAIDGLARLAAFRTGIAAAQSGTRTPSVNP